MVDARIFGMNVQSRSDEKTGILGIVDGITAEENVRLINADLEDCREFTV